MSSNRPNLTLDERAFEGLLSAAFTIQEHNDRQKQTQPSAVAEAKASTLCRHCGALKPLDRSPCPSCGLEEFRPGERLQRNWASMWLHSQYQMQWPEPPAEARVDLRTRRFADTTRETSADTSRFAFRPAPGAVRDGSSPSVATQTDAAITDTSMMDMAMTGMAHATVEDAILVGAARPGSVAADAAPLAKSEPAFQALEPAFEADVEANFDSHYDPVLNSADALPVSMFHRFSDWRVKLRFQRADLYLGLAIFVSATALLWPAAVPPRPEALNSWERALVILGIAEAPTPLVHLQGDPGIQVWVDPHTALYYCPGDEQYEKTDGGRLGSQREAQADRFEPASRSACE
jgi:ribosomal protein L40E